MSIDFTDPRWLTVILVFATLVIMWSSWINVVFFPSRKKVVEGITLFKLKESGFLLLFSEFSLFLMAFFFTKCNPIAFVLLVIFGYFTYQVVRYHYYFNDLIVCGTQSYWTTKPKTIKWVDIQTIIYHPLLMSYQLVDDRNNRVWLSTERCFDGFPNFFEHLKRYNPTVELKNITWEKIDKIIENGQNP
jgi:hypothetical protein